MDMWDGNINKPADISEEVAKLRELLDAALLKEDYETAVVIRDRIKKAESSATKYLVPTNRWESARKLGEDLLRRYIHSIERENTAAVAKAMGVPVSEVDLYAARARIVWSVGHNYYFDEQEASKPDTIVHWRELLFDGKCLVRYEFNLDGTIAIKHAP